MYEKKNKLSQPAPNLAPSCYCTVVILLIVYCNIDENAPFFFKTVIFDECFG